MRKPKVKWIAIIVLLVIVTVALLTVRTGKENVMFVCDGFVSDDVLLDTFDNYQKKCQPFYVSQKPTYISFDVGFPVKSCRVTRASYVDESNMEEELHSYIDSRIGTRMEGSTIKLDTSWWYSSGEWTQQHKLWSYLMLIEDMEGQEHNYYCRVNFQ